MQSLILFVGLTCRVFNQEQPLLACEGDVDVQSHTHTVLNPLPVPGRGVCSRLDKQEQDT